MSRTKRIARSGVRLTSACLGAIVSMVLLPVVAQAQSVEWARSGGGAAEDHGGDIGVDAAGNSYVTGYYQGTATFGSLTLTTAGFRDIFVVKYDSSGDAVWAQTAGGTGSDAAERMAVDAAGNVYVTGAFQGAATFGSFTLTSAGSNDVFVVKYDTGGNVLWARSAGGTLGDEGWGVAVDATGDIYVSGVVRGTATFGSFTLSSMGDRDIFLAKYDTAGNILWARSAGGTSGDQTWQLAVDGAANCYVTGFYQGTATFGSFMLTAAGGPDIFVAKYDPDGNVLWAHSAGGASYDSGSGIAVDFAGNIFVTGVFVGTADFGSGPVTSAGSEDFFLAKYDASFNLLWARATGSTAKDQGRAIAVDAAGNAFVTGVFDGTVAFGLSHVLTSAGGRDILVAKYDGSGTVLWARSHGATSHDGGNGVAVDAAGNSYVAGAYGGTATFDAFTLTSNGHFDIFVAKYAAPPTPPTCDADGPYSAECGGITTDAPLDGTASTDPDGDPLTFLWTTDCPGGSFDDETSDMPILTVDTAPGCGVNCNVTLAVDDGNGGTDSCSTTVTIADTQPPEVTCSATPVGRGHRGRGEQELLIEYSAWDECGEVTGSAVIETRCCPLPVADGQVVKVKCENHEKCRLEIDFVHDKFKIKADQAALLVTATDECGNTAICEVELCTPDDDGDDDDDDGGDDDDGDDGDD